MKENSKIICVIGDVHGHLQLALCVASRLQDELKIKFEAIFLCGDVGTFTDESQLDNATRRHSKSNPCELEFLHQWSKVPQPNWIKKIFMAKSENGLGIECPVVMIHGNHEGFQHLRNLIPKKSSLLPIDIKDLPNVDSGNFIKYLPSGFICKTESGILIGGIGGIEKNSRYAAYDDLAYINEIDVLKLLYQKELDLLITHQGPYAYQSEYGAKSLDPLVETELASVWCHCHAALEFNIGKIGLSLKRT